MSGSVRLSRTISLAAALALAGAAVCAEAPARVVSVNLCTDQLALGLAAPGQLLSVSALSHDPASSAMWEEARALPTNNSSAEDVYLLAPDLVLAGTFTAPATVAMLERLGIEVAVFAPASSLEDIPRLIRQMGAALGRQAEAERRVAAFEADLAALREAAPDTRPRAALTYVNSYSSGDKTLAGAILKAAGFDNVAREAGLSSVGVLSLEQLVLLAPDVIITGRNYEGAARAEDNLDHPALRALAGTYHAGELTDKDWICGTPTVLRAIRAMADLRQRAGGAE
jgi:iron complex transport system substrate-binding protein